MNLVEQVEAKSAARVAARTRVHENPVMGRIPSSRTLWLSEMGARHDIIRDMHNRKGARRRIPAYEGIVERLLMHGVMRRYLPDPDEPCGTTACGHNVGKKCKLRRCQKNCSSWLPPDVMEAKAT